VSEQNIYILGGFKYFMKIAKENKIEVLNSLALLILL